MSRSIRLWIVLGLNLALVGVLAAVGIGAHSSGVMAEGADYLADAAAIGVALLAIRQLGFASVRSPRISRSSLEEVRTREGPHPIVGLPTALNGPYCDIAGAVMSNSPD